MPADNSRHLRAAARRRSEQTRKRAIKALRRLDSDGSQITFDAVARAAGVSRSWLYAHVDIRDEIERLRRLRQPATRLSTVPSRQRASDASLLRRLEAATERIHRLEHDNRELRDALAAALGEQRHARVIGSPTHHDTPGKGRSRILGPC
jgi:hypothetical protein